ncbi:MAG TPA: RNA methyltransferase [Thermodesulfovibrionales bacterium]|nr:RNA methyltransferase [Thermodesulfovibrionales bacterium]
MRKRKTDILKTAKPKTAHWKDNISFILVEPKEPGNIGASARAMKNMGFTRLGLVKPRNFMADETKKMACNAFDILAKAEIYGNLNEALQEKTLVVGTTRRLGRTRGLILPLEEGTKKIIASAKKNRVALLFGREDKGLNNREVEECGFLITIPSDPSSPSLNLAQSVLLVAYGLSKGTYKGEFPKATTRSELESLLRHIRATLKLLEYIPRGNRDLEARIMRNLKHLIARAGLTDWELRMLHGICGQIEKKMGKL